MNYSDDVVFPIEYKRTEDLYGITSDLILNKYIAVDINNLQELVKAEDNEELSNIISKDNINIQNIKEEVQKLKEIIFANLKEENFSKIDEENFALILNEKETAKIGVEILEEIKNIESLPQNTKEALNNKIIDIKAEEYTEEECVRVIVNKSGKLTIEIKNKANVNIQKINNELIIEASSSQSKNKIVLTIRENRK